MIDLPAPSLQPLPLPDHHLPCGSPWWLVIHRRKSKARAFRTHSAPGSTLYFTPTGFGSSSSPCPEVLLFLCPPLRASWRESTSLAAQPPPVWIGHHVHGKVMLCPACSWPMTERGEGTRNSVALFQWAALGQGLPGGLAKAVSEVLCHQDASFPLLSQGSDLHCSLTAPPAQPAPSPFIRHTPSPSKSLVCLILIWYYFSETQIDTARASPDSHQAESSSFPSMFSAPSVYTC